MRTPQPSPRRSGWLVLLAVAGVVVGAAVATRLTERRRSGRPTVAAARPALPRPAPPSGSTDPSRSLVRMAVGAAVVVVLALVTVVATRPSDRTASPHWVLTPSPGQSGMYVMVTARGPVGRAERVAMTGRDGCRAEIEIKQVGEPRTETTGFSGQRNVMFTLHLHNTGEVWIGSRLDPGAWVRDQYGQSHEANQMLSVSSGPTGATDPNANRGWQLDPDWEVDRNVVFTVPENARLTRLHIVVPMGDATPTAEWNL